MTVVWVVLPTYNEHDNLPLVLAGARRALATCRPRVDAVLLVVDDASPDGTGDLADRLAAEHPDVQVLHRPGKGGLGAAYRAGFERALEGGADLVVEMDADLSHDPADLPRLVAAVRDGADIALGSRYVAGGATPDWPLRRRMVSRAGGRYAALVLGLDVRDLTGGYKCLRAGVLRAVGVDAAQSRGYAFQIELTYHAVLAGATVAEVPITFHERRHGRSKMSPAIALEALWRVPLLRLRTAAHPAGLPAGPRLRVTRP